MSLSISSIVNGRDSETTKNGYEIPQDFNGALRIFLKGMWDNTTFTDSVGDIEVDIQNISDVQKCLG